MKMTAYNHGVVSAAVSDTDDQDDEADDDAADADDDEKADSSEKSTGVRAAHEHLNLKEPPGSGPGRPGQAWPRMAKPGRA